METVWTILGIEPTKDVLAVKRAYAVQLKRSRPDEDAFAYQRLRESYEWALRWARDASATWPVEAEDDDAMLDALPSELPPDLTAAVTAFLRPSPPGVSNEESPTADDRTATPDSATLDEDRSSATDADGDTGWIDADALVRDLHAVWQADGDEASIALWPQLRHALDGQPLSERDGSSITFADFVLAHPALPAATLDQLARYFHWSTDYRADAALGAERAEAIMQRLRASGLQRVTNPATLRRYADLLTLQRLVDAGRRIRAAVFAALTMPQVGLLLRDAPPAELRNLGIEATQRSAMRVSIKWSMMIWYVLLAAAFVPLVQSRWDYQLLPSAVAGVLAVLALGTTVFYSTGLVGMLDHMQQLFAPRSQPRNLRHGASIAVALLGAATSAWMDHSTPFDDSPLHALWLPTWPLAFALAWHATAQWRFALLPVAIAMSIGLAGLLPDSVPAGVAAGFGLAWTLAAHWMMSRQPALVQRLYTTPPSAYLPDTAGGWVLFVVALKGILGVAAALVILATPLTYLRQCDRHTAPFTLLVLGIALTVGVILQSAPAWWWAPIVLVPLALSCALVIGGRLARSRLFQ